MLSIFSYDHYRPYLKDFLLNLPKKGHGELSRIAHHLSVHSTLMSLILAGERDFTLEQAYDMSVYLNLTDLESEYFSLLVQYERGGNHRFKSFIRMKLDKVKSEANRISNRFVHEKTLNDEQRSIFYSSWLYSAIRLFTSTKEKGVSVDDVITKFSITRQRVVAILDFLAATGLVLESKGLYSLGIQRTFLEQGSPHLVKHHSNWRIKAIQKSDHLTEKELMFTSPISISRKDFESIREQIAELLKSVSVKVKESEVDDIACLNIDLFWIE